MTLTELAKKFSSDKLFLHSYLEHYENLLAHRQVKRLLEVGIGYKDLMTPFLPEGVEYHHGSSLKMWSAYWPEAEIWACDIRENTLINEGRIKSVVCDQSSGQSLAEMVFKVTEGLLNTLDVVIDDASHQFEHQRLTASVLLPRMSKDSIYIIEDTYPNKGAALAREFGGELIIGNKRPDDCLVIIRR